MKTRYKQILQIRNVVQGEVEHEITVKNINGKYHCRVFTNGELNREAMCEDRLDIGYTCRSLLRWEDKCGNWSDFASSSRERLNKL
jgi:hypothetical protein